jgi:hypothetical protein
MSTQTRVATSEPSKHLSSLLTNGNGGPFPGVRRQVHGADHTHSSSPEVKNSWSYTYTPSYIFMAGCLILSNGCLHGVVLSTGTTLPDAWYEGVSKSFRTGRLERELQMVQLSATRCSCIAILWVSLVSSAAITLCVASQQVFVVYCYHRPVLCAEELLILLINFIKKWSRNRQFCLTPVWKKKTVYFVIDSVRKLLDTPASAIRNHSRFLYQ